MAWDWTPIREILMGVVVPGLSALLLGALFELARVYIARLRDERLRYLLLRLVEAAEQIYGPGRGEEKANYVAKALRQEGVLVSAAEIESAVYALNERQRLIAGGPGEKSA